MVNPTNIGLMAPWYSHLNKAEANGVVSKAEVKKDIEPWIGMAEGPKSNSYQKSLLNLLANKEPNAHLSKGARPELAALLSHTKIAGKFHHTAADVSNVSWSFGSGVHHPLNMPNVGPSIALSVTFNTIDIQPKTKVSIDEKTRTITVSLDGVANSEIHPKAMTKPKDLNIPVKRPKQLGAEYKIIVRDGNPTSATVGKILGTATFPNMLPM